ncbi:MAG TPA: hypothetical protein VJS69_11000 [Candidatus Krumholzibacteria bacterium]|nr:hypothetical protein [Candidatus Krumholzibacteria bacterium]
MGEILSALTAVITRIFDVLVLPFGSHRTAGLIALSMLTGAGLTLLYRALADEAGIRRTREVFKARVIEMRLYPDDLVLILRALGGAIAAQGAYLRVAAKPILVVALIAIPFFIQVESRYACAPLAPGARTVVTARLKPGLDVRQVPSGLAGTAATDASSVRAPATREIAWRVNALPGRQPLQLEVYGQSYRFNVCAQRDGRAIGHERRARSLMGALTDIGMPSISNDSPIETVTIAYPRASYALFGAHMSWLWVFALGTMVGASIPAVLLRVAL